MTSKIALPLGVVALLGVAVFLAFEVAGIREAVTAEPDQAFTGTLLITSNRSNLSVCIDGAGGATVGAAAVDTVRQATEDGLESVSDIFVRASEYREGLQVSLGCPPATAALTPGDMKDTSRRHGDILGDPVHATTINAVSQHRVHVYLVPPTAYQSAFGGKPYAMGAAEFLCSGHVCAEVTTAVYVPEGVALLTLSEGLLDAIGFLPATYGGDPPEDRQQAEEERERELELAP